MTKLLNIGLLVLGCQAINLDSYNPENTQTSDNIPVINTGHDCEQTSCDKKKKSPGSQSLAQLNTTFIDDYDYDT